jgi:hypothetical protein
MMFWMFVLCQRKKEYMKREREGIYTTKNKLITNKKQVTKETEKQWWMLNKHLMIIHNIIKDKNTWHFVIDKLSSK